MKHVPTLGFPKGGFALAIDLVEVDQLESLEHPSQLLFVHQRMPIVPPLIVLT